MISIIVVDYNGKEVTEACLASIRASDYTDYELIVIDNYGTGRGYGAGCNLGIKQVRGDIIICINNDVEVSPDWLTHIAKAMTNAEIGVANPSIFHPGSLRAHGIINKIGWFGLTYEVREGTPDYANGACMILRKKVLDKVGLFDESYHMYGEDSDLSLRIRKAGYKCVVIPDAWVWHRGGSSVNRMNWFKVKWWLMQSRWRKICAGK
jgi:GT2 family glycosyltransferase